MSSHFPIRPSEFRKSSRSPLYARLQARLQELIEAGYWKPNEQIPTEREIAQATGISVNTVKQALSNLVRERYVHRRQGAGTFVTSPETLLGLHRYYAMKQSFGENSQRHKIAYLGLQSDIINDEAASIFKDQGPTKFYKLERLLYVGNKKSIYTSSLLPEHIFSGFHKISIECIESTPLYEIFAHNFKAPCRLSKELLSVALLNKEIAAHLDVDENYPALRSFMMGTSHNGNPIEVRESFIVTDDWHLYREF